ncbi:Endoglucanase 1 [Dendrobium catenatum]|uniref:Endoglucanase n=1 Tax=Dendrobium catenatum TaxID=906689 RepID=A0A2I0WI93_9ASPA|nr:Endoglucanase 1 [Dendrobium catenatum]
MNQDELLWGAAWLQRASGNASYMSYIKSNGHVLGAEDDDFSFSWDDKRVGTKVLLSKVIEQLNYILFLLRKQSKGSFINQTGVLASTGLPGTKSCRAAALQGPHRQLHMLSGARIKWLPSSIYTSKWARTLQRYKLHALHKFVWQVDYILGENPAKISYMVGFGGKYPLHVHHRGSSIPSTRALPGHISCNDGFQYLHSSSPNPNVLVGAIVGGPDSNDGFADDRANYQQSEPTTYINAPMVGALAFFAGAATA